MNTLYFKYALEVYKAKSITQAADNLFMAQPNLSKAIKELEDTLGFAIFERTSKGVIATQKGSDFLVYAKNIILELNKIDSISNSNEQDVQSFSLSLPRASYIANGVTNFVKELDFNRNIGLNVQETNSMQVITNITDAAFNLGIIRFQTNHENYFIDYLNDKQLSYELIWEFEKVVVMSSNHSLAPRDNIKHEELLEYIEIIYGDISVPYLPFGEGKKNKEDSNYNKRIYIYERSSQFDLLSSVKDTFIWSSPVPSKLLTLHGFTQKKCTDYNKKYKDLLIYPKSYKFSVLDKAFIDKLYEAKNEVAFI